MNKELSLEDIGLELSTIYKFEDKGKLSKSKALCITKDFFSQSGQVVGADFNERFLKFLSDNPKYTVSNEEIDHIISRDFQPMFPLLRFIEASAARLSHREPGRLEK